MAESHFAEREDLKEEGKDPHQGPSEKEDLVKSSRSDEVEFGDLDFEAFADVGDHLVGAAHLA
jgi:hypothetical protein